MSVLFDTSVLVTAVVDTLPNHSAAHVQHRYSFKIQTLSSAPLPADTAQVYPDNPSSVGRPYRLSRKCPSKDRLKAPEQIMSRPSKTSKEATPLLNSSP